MVPIKCTKCSHSNLKVALLYQGKSDPGNPWCFYWLVQSNWALRLQPGTARQKKDNSGQGQCQAQGLLNYLSHSLMQICEIKPTGLSEALHLYVKPSSKCRNSVSKLIFNQTVHSPFLQLLQQISLLRKSWMGEQMYIIFCLIFSSQIYILLSSPHATPRLLGNDGKRS